MQTYKSIRRYLKNSFIFSAKNVSLGWNVTKSTPLVELLAVLSIFLKTNRFICFLIIFYRYPRARSLQFDYILSAF